MVPFLRHSVVVQHVRCSVNWIAWSISQPRNTC